MTGEVLLAGASVRSLAESAVAAGFRPWCCDFFGDRDLLQLLSQCGGRYLRTLNSFAELPAVLETVPQQIPLCWSGGLENAAEILEQSGSGGRRVCGATAAAVRAVRTWQNLQSWVEGTGVRFPETISSTGKVPSGDWLLKPVRSAGGAGVRRLREGDEWLRAAADAGAGTECLLQRYITGAPISMVFHAGADQLLLLGCSLQFCGWRSLGAVSGDALWCGNGGPLRLPEVLQRQAVRLALRIVQAAGLSGVFGVDFLLSAGELWLLEVNPRIPASHWIYDAGQRGLAVRLQLTGEADGADRVGDLTGFRAQFVVWHGEPTGPAGELLRSVDLPTGMRLADEPVSANFSAGVPACSVLLNAETFGAAIGQLDKAAGAETRLQEFWQQTSADLSLAMQTYQRHLPTN